VLYGDNAGGHALPDAAPLVSFAEQAGRTLDEALLAQRADGPAA
jgi:hypothetical protein